jgi:hypothetical protein
MSFGIPVRNGLGIGLTPSTALSSGRIGGRPALVLNFVDTTTLDSRITFTRSTTATFVGSDGLIQTAAINAPRFDYDPVTLAPKGLLIEELRRNIFLNSLINGTSLSTQTVTVTAVAHTISFYGTGTITLSGAAVAIVTGTGVYPNRQTLTFTPTAGSLICTVLGSVQYAQLEIGAFASSFIPTAGSAISRAADVASMTSTNFSSWYNQSEGSFVSTFSFFASADTVNTKVFAASSDGTTSNRVSSNVNAASVPFGTVTAGGTAQANMNTGTTLTNNTVAKVALAYKLNDFAAVLNGGTVATDTSGTVPTVNQLGIGTLAAFSAINGHMRQIAYYNTRLPNTTLQVLTV